MSKSGKLTLGFSLCALGIALPFMADDHKSMQVAVGICIALAAAGIGMIVWTFAGSRRTRSTTRPRLEEDLAVQMRQLPRIPLKKALRIEVNFLAWSQLTFLWGLFGLFFVIIGWMDAFDPISPRAFRVDAVITTVGWAMIVIAQGGLSERKASGPWCLLGASVLLLLRDIGMLVMGFAHPLLRLHFGTVIGIRLTFMLAMLPLFGSNVRRYLAYTALDKRCFRKGGIGRKVLQE